MRSAIFNKEPLSFSDARRQARPRSALKNTPPNINTSNSPIVSHKLKISSPRISEVSKSSNSDSKKNLHNGTSLSWNLDDMLSSYQEYRILPPILSPTIPQDPSVGNVEREKKSNINEELPLSMLSPTLPGIFTASKESTPITTYPKLVQPKPKQAIQKSASKLVDIPSNQLQNTRVHNSRARVRWIDKSQEIRPKFLLRINFDNKLKYKGSFLDSKTVSPRKINGLGISSSHNEPVSGTTEVDEQKVDSNQRAIRKQGNGKDKNQTSSREVDEGSGLKVQEDKVDKVDKQQTKTTQLRKLSDDVFRNENLHPSDSERIRVLNSESPILLKKSNSSLTEKEREDFKSNLTQKKNYWIKIARKTRAESQKTKDPILAIMISFDALLLYMISYDYDEKLKVISDILPLERYWNSLYHDCSNLIGQIKKQITVKSSTEISLSSGKASLDEYLEFFIGILYQTKAIILKRVNSVFEKVIDLYIFKKKDTNQNDIINELNNKIIELQQSTINNCKRSIIEFSKAQPFTSLLSQVPTNFPNTWHNKSPQINPIQPYETSLVPGGDNYFLPIGIYTDLREISGFMFSCVREFGEIFLSTKSSDGKINLRYNLQSGLKGAPSDEFIEAKS